MLATFSPEMQINRILNEIGCVPSNFSEIANRHANSRVIQALKGTNDFSPGDGAYYLGVARQMKKLAEEFPVPIDWRQTQVIKEILAARRTRGRPTPFFIIQFHDGTLFKKMVNGKAERTTSYDDCAAATFEAARQMTKLLDTSGHICRMTEITNYRRDNISDSIQEFGFGNESQREFTHLVGANL